MCNLTDYIGQERNDEPSYYLVIENGKQVKKYGEPDVDLLSPEKMKEVEGNFEIADDRHCHPRFSSF